MTNEVERSLGQKTRLFLDYCCFCGLLGQIHPKKLTMDAKSSLGTHLGNPSTLPNISYRLCSCSGFCV